MGLRITNVHTDHPRCGVVGIWRNSRGEVLPIKCTTVRGHEGQHFCDVLNYSWSAEGESFPEYGQWIPSSCSYAPQCKMWAVVSALGRDPDRHLYGVLACEHHWERYRDDVETHSLGHAMIDLWGTRL